MSKTIRYLLGGALAGAILGAAVGIGMYRMRQQLPAGSRTAGLRKPVDYSRAFQVGMSAFALIRQILELGR